jgi:hypothetical protein
MVFLFRPVFEEEFYQNVQVFAVAAVLREMLSSVSKWNKSLIENEAQELQSEVLSTDKNLKSIELIDARKFTLSKVAYKAFYQSFSSFTSSCFSVIKTKPRSGNFREFHREAYRQV